MPAPAGITYPGPAHDVFVWDATLVHGQPKPAPNSNVAIELGYALASLGAGRIVGIMNTATGGPPEDLPFHLRHRRWPLQYSLSTPTSAGQVVEDESVPGDGQAESPFVLARRSVRATLVEDLKSALEAALREPKVGEGGSSVDSEVAKRLWSELDSERLRRWFLKRIDDPQHEEESYVEALRSYADYAERPENGFHDPALRASHGDFVATISAYISTVLTEMELDSPGYYAISTKKKVYSPEEYDRRYEAQTEAVTEAATVVNRAWRRYVQDLQRRCPEVPNTAPRASRV